MIKVLQTYKLVSPVSGERKVLIGKCFVMEVEIPSGVVVLLACRDLI